MLTTRQQAMIPSGRRTTGELTRLTSIASGRAETLVEFRPLTESEIAAYVESGEPLDKAGAYAIQGGAAGFVARREGRLDNVVGLPIDLARALLKRLQV